MQLYIFQVPHATIYILQVSHVAIYMLKVSHAATYMLQVSHVAIYMSQVSHVAIYMLQVSHVAIYMLNYNFNPTNSFLLWWRLLKFCLWLVKYHLLIIYPWKVKTPLYLIIHEQRMYLHACTEKLKTRKLVLCE